MNRRFEVYHYRQILLHMRQGTSNRGFKSSRLIGRAKAKKVRAIAEKEGWLDPATNLPSDEILAEKLKVIKAKKSTTSQVAPFADQVTKWVEEGVQATTIWATLKRTKGFEGAYSSVQRFVQQVKPAKTNPTMILDFKPGEAAQVDFGSGPVIIDPATGKSQRTWFFLMTLASSRHAYAEVVPDQTIRTWQECHRRAFEFFGGVPSKVIIDNLKSGITKACLYDPEVQRSYETFAEGYGFIIGPCPPHDPEKKGRVESGVKYLKKAFMPLRSFRSLLDANQQLREWLLNEAGLRIHGTTGKQPLMAFETMEKAFLRPLPAVPPETVEWAKARVHRNTHALFAKNWYSVPFSLIGQDVWLRAGSRTVQVFHQEKLVATHPRVFGHGEHITVTDHLAPACRAYVERSPEWCREQSVLVGVCCQEVIERYLDHPRVEHLRAAQRVLRFRESHGADHLETACEKALGCNAVRISTIRAILNRLAQEASEVGLSEPSMNPAYQGNGRFVRDDPWGQKGSGEKS